MNKKDGVKNTPPYREKKKGIMRYFILNYKT